jgi:hypothetical protein
VKASKAYQKKQKFFSRHAQSGHARYTPTYFYGSMNDKREWRPTLSSNVSSPQVGVLKPSEAIRGAARQAFNAGSIPSNVSSTAKPISSGARSAAAAAGNARRSTAETSLEQNARNTNTAGFAVAAYTRGRAPPVVERQSSNAGLFAGPVLSPQTQPYAPAGASPGSQAQQAARMASKSRSPAGRKAYSPSLQDTASMPQDPSASLAGKLASLRSHQEILRTSSSHSQTRTPVVEISSLNLKQIPHLPKRLPAQTQQEASSGKLAGAAAAQAAARHAQQSILTSSPRIEASEYFPFPTTESLSPDRSTIAGSLEAVSTRSTHISLVESPQSSALDDTTRSINDQSKSAPIATGTAPRRSPGALSGGTQSGEHRLGLTERRFADAIVAGSLASSRAPSPTKVDASLTGSWRSRSHSHASLSHLPHHLFHHDKAPDLPTRSSHAPPRSLKHTLRKPSDHQEDEEEEVTKRGRKHFMRKHPHKHHEGDRKRWRDKVTERERRRYEGVWAANRGLFTFWEEEPAFGESWKRGPEYNLVVNVVVRDIWDRSRLPKDVLGEIWDLVATSEDAQALQRDQFVVGLWLIDQRLKGRKLPVRVSTDVWNSVRHTHGVKVSRKPY